MGNGRYEMFMVHVLRRTKEKGANISLGQV